MNAAEMAIHQTALDRRTDLPRRCGGDGEGRHLSFASQKLQEHVLESGFLQGNVLDGHALPNQRRFNRAQLAIELNVNLVAEDLRSTGYPRR